VWQSDNQTGGFTSGTPWLPVPVNHLRHAGQTGEGSLFAHYKSALALRKRHPVLRNGAQTGMVADGDVLHFIRLNKDDTVFCGFNLGETTQELALPQGRWQTETGAPCGVTTKLGPWQTCLFIKA
jgi:alpha-glucosidase